jgi:oligopeptide transport system substrate-binding protein
MRHQFSRWTMLCFVFLLSIALLGGCQKDSVPATPPITASSLTVVPNQPVINQIITIGINVLNSGKQAGDYYAVFKVNDSVIDTKQVTVAPGETQTLTFQYTPVISGNFRVDINGQTASFTVVKPAAFTIGSLNVLPEHPVMGSDLTANFQVSNTGDLSGNFTASLKLDGQEIVTSPLTLDAGASKNVSLKFSISGSGSHVVDVGGQVQEVKVLKPAFFKAVSVFVSPSSVLPGETVKIDADIRNDGESKDTGNLVLTVNGNEAGKQSLTLEPGATGHVSYSYLADASGYFTAKILDVTGNFSVLSLSSYSNSLYYYTISYPPDFKVKEDKKYFVHIAKDQLGELSVYCDRVATSMTIQEFYDKAIKNNQDYYTAWQISNKTEILKDGKLVGYKFENTCTMDGTKHLGRGSVIMTPGMGYSIDFDITETEWTKYSKVVDQAVNSFKPPSSFVGNYVNADLGLSFSLPSSWIALETGKNFNPVNISASDVDDVEGFINISSVDSNTTPQKYFESQFKFAVAAGWVLGKGESFTLLDGTIGYACPINGTLTSGVIFVYRIYSIVKDGRGVILAVVGPSTLMSSNLNQITKFAASLVVSKPGAVAGVDRSLAVYFPEGEIATLDPALVETGPGEIIGAIFSGLVRFDTSLKIVPDLAESWVVSNNGLTYTFTLRKNAKFQDGRLITASDVKYSWERACDPVLKSNKASSFLADIKGAADRLAGKSSTISGIKVIDDYTLEITLASAKAYFLSELCQPVAFVVDRNDIIKGSNWYEHPNGSGPFRLNTWQKDKLMVLERNENFYLAPAKVKYLVFKLFAGIPVQLYQKGDVDMAPVGTDDQDKVLDPTNNLSKEVVSGASTSMDYLGMNVTLAPFDDIKIRQAVSLALDIPKLIEVSIKGRAQRVAGYVPPGVPGNNPDLKAASVSLEKARQLIADSKYGSVDRVPEITFYALYAVSPVDQAIIGMLQNLGLKVKAQIVNSQDDYIKRAHNHEFQLFVSGWRADYLDPQNFLEILFQSQSSENSFAYNNPQVDAALAQAAIEQDPEKRLKMYQDVEKMVLADLPAIPLWCNSMSYVLVKPYIKGYVVYPININIWRELGIVPH